jgi:hypothetical protein
MMSVMAMFQQLGRLVHNLWRMKNTLLALFGLVLMANVVMFGGTANPTPVEVWTGGDDGLTQRLRDEIENKFKSSSEFVLSNGNKAGTLIVTIPTHVAWTTAGTRTHLRYSVQFSSSDGTVLKKSSGSCWDDHLKECAAQTYREAQKTAHKLH